LQTFMIIFDNMDDLIKLTVNTNVFTMTSATFDEISMIKNQIPFQNMIMFSCDKEDACNEQFMYDYLEWVYRITYNLAAVIRPLLLTENGRKGKSNKQVTLL
jgi:hypothetical protein